MTARTLAVALVAVVLLAGCSAIQSGPGATGTEGATATGAGTVPESGTSIAETTERTPTPTPTPDRPVPDDDGLNASEERALGTNVTLADTDGDGLTDDRERRLDTNATLADTDEDGLGDGAELLATETLPGADPLHRDVFLEVDYMAGHRPDAAMLDTVERRFAAAPVPNPDGERGIDLHIRIDQQVPARASIVAANRPGELNDVFDYRRNYSQLDRRGHYYGVVVRELGYPNASTWDLQGYALGDFFASEQTTDPDVQDNVFMHELGHVLGLGPWRHPGIDSRRIPFDVYPSSMNYRAPGDHIRFSDGSGGPADFDDWRAIANCHGWAGYDDRYPSVESANVSIGGGRQILKASVGCL